MAQQKEKKLVYPPGVKELTEDISTDELYRRLKVCVKVLQTISQEDDNSKYQPLAFHLASDFFLDHRSKDIRRGAALCIADIFRIFAPVNPYSDPKILEALFNLFIDQLKGLTSASGTNFTGSFYLLENLTIMKTFNLCHDTMQKPEEIVIPLFKQMFNIIRVLDNPKVSRLTLNMLCPLIAESDNVPHQLLEFILTQIIEPNKSSCERTYNLAQDLLKQTATVLEPYIQTTFIKAMGGQQEDVISEHLYELIYELNLIIPSEIIVVVNNLENKLMSSLEEERIEVLTLLSKLFSDKSSKMIEQNKVLWSSYISRYKDASTKVRCLHMKFSKNLLMNHPQTSKPALIECFMFNIVDPDDRVRKQTCQTISETVPELYDVLDPELWESFQERARDKNYEIRQTVLTCFGKLCQRWTDEGIPPVLYDANFKLDWIKNKILHRYYGESVQEKQLVEQLFNRYVVPYRKPAEERMKLFYQLYCTIDEPALKALAEMIKTRNVLRSHVNKLLGVMNMDNYEMKWYNVYKIAPVLSVFSKEPNKGNAYATAFGKLLEKNARLSTLIGSVANGSISCSAAAIRYKEILEEVKNTEKTELASFVAQMITRIVPIIDKECVKHLLTIVDNSFQGDCSIEADLGLENSFLKGFELIKMLSLSNPALFQNEETFKLLMSYLRVENEEVTVPALQILCNICKNLSETYPAIYEQLSPILLQYAEYGKPMQAKHSVFLLNKIVPENSRAEFFMTLMRTLQIHFTLKSEHFKTALVSSGHIAHNWRHLFPNPEFKDMVTFIVSTVLMHDGDFPRGGTELWGPYDNLPDESKVKIEGMKCIVRWLTGKEKFVKPTITTLRCLSTYIENGGDLTEQRHNSPMENSWLRLSAACRMLKLCHVPDYAVALSLKQFQILGYVLNDPCPEVCDIFAKKLNKALYLFKLPLQFLAVFALGGLNERKEFKANIKNYLTQNIEKRRQKLREKAVTQADNLSYLPEYTLPYAIHLLAHAPFFGDYSCISSLKKIRNCLQMFMECLIAKNEGYSFAFFKRLVENIKQTKDKQDPEDEDTNLRLYAVCDLALNIIMSQKNYILKDFPAEPVLNKRFFTDPDLSYSNMRTYLPPEFLQEQPVQSCFEIDFAEMSKLQNTTSQIQTSLDNTQDNLSRSDNENREDLASEEEISVVKKKRTAPKNSHQSQSNVEFAAPGENRSKRIPVTKVQNGSVRKRGRPKRITKKSGRTKDSASNSETVSSDEGGNSDVQVDSSDGISVNISDSDSIKRLIKECNVCLNLDEIEQYAGPLRMNNVSPIKTKRGKNNSLVLNSHSLKNGAPSFQNNLSDSEVSAGRSSNRKRVASPEKESPTNNKKKKDTAPSLRSLRSNASSSAVEEESSASSSISDTKASSSVDSIQSFTSSIIKYAPKRSGAASVIVQNSQNNAIRQTKSKILSNQINESVEENSSSRKEKPVTRSNKVTSSIKTTNSIVTRTSARTAKNKVIEAKSRPKRR
nr:sister chromatid cohesion protein PDS5 homolog A isoform X2 [Parasteatoda tepidariorum]